MPTANRGVRGDEMFLLFFLTTDFVNESNIEKWSF